MSSSHSHEHSHGEHTHNHEHGGHSHSHEHAGHGHTHEHMEHPGIFEARPLPTVDRDFSRRSFTVGIGGPVGSGKTALLLALCLELRERFSLAAVTNDIFTREDADFLLHHDVSSNLLALEELTARIKPDLLFCESGGDNLAAHFSRELADYTIYVIDVSGGDKIPRKGGPGITQSDLLVINKTDLAEAIGADLAVMERDSAKMRGAGPFILARVKHGEGVSEIVDHVLKAWETSKAGA